MSSSVVRALRILDLLAHVEKPMPLTRIAETLGIPKSTAYGILRDLARESFVEIREPASYAIGLKAFEVGAAHLRITGAVGMVAPELLRLTSAIHVTSHYAILDRTDAVYLCKEDPPGLGVQLASSIGARLPSHLTAVGKACLAWLDADRVREHVDLEARVARSGPRALEDVLGGLEQVRSRGYATDDGVAAAGIQCVAAPVFDMSRCRGAIGVSYLLGDDRVLEEIVAAVRGTAARVTTLLGGQVAR